MMEENEEKLLRSVALQTSTTILRARQRAEHELKQAKKELEEKARQLDHSLSILRATIEATADGILVTDEEGTVLRFNELYLEMWPIHQRDLQFKRAPATAEILLQVLKGSAAVPGQDQKRFTQPGRRIVTICWNSPMAGYSSDFPRSSTSKAEYRPRLEF